MLQRTVVQLVEHRSPKPGVAGSIPACPATTFYRNTISEAGSTSRMKGNKDYEIRGKLVVSFEMYIPK